MQLGKLDVCQPSQKVSSKTQRNRPKSDQGVTPAKQNPEFEPLEHSVYLGRRLLGRYERVSKKKYAAYDTADRLLGRFTKLANVQRAFNDLAVGGAQ